MIIFNSISILILCYYINFYINYCIKRTILYIIYFKHFINILYYEFLKISLIDM